MEDWQERDREADRIQKMYRDVEDEIAAVIAAAFAAGIPRGVSDAITASRQMLVDAYEQTQVWNGEAIPYLYGETTELSATTIPAITADSEARFLSMTQTAMRRLDDLSRAFDVATARREALRAYQGVRWELSTEELARELEASLRAHGITGFVDAAGRRWKLASYADMAARTTTMQAQLDGIKDRAIAAGHDLVRIVGPLDYPDGCPASVLNGPYSLTGATTEYQKQPIITLAAAVAKYGVFHPRCRHSIVAVA